MPTSEFLLTTSAMANKPARCYKFNHSELVVKVDLLGVQKKFLVITVCNQYHAIIALRSNTLVPELFRKNVQTTHRLELNYSQAIRFSQTVLSSSIYCAVYDDSILLSKIPFETGEALPKTAYAMVTTSGSSLVRTLRYERADLGSLISSNSLRVLKWLCSTICSAKIILILTGTDCSGLNQR